MTKSGLKRFAVIILLVSGCASEAPPPGGPKDTTPPRIVKTTPENGAINVAKNTAITLNFSEYLNNRSVEPAIFISPYIDKTEYKVGVHRKTVTITFINPLKDSTTYILTLGTGVTDLRGNALNESYHLAFSTGQKINEGTMSGKIFRQGLPKGNVSLLAFHKNASVPDSLLTRRPDYLSNPDKQGIFHFDNMIPGEYLFMALQDKNSNYIYDPGEWTGIAPKIYWAVTDTLLHHALQMQMAQYPADSLVLTSVEQKNRHQLIAGLNRPPLEQPDSTHFLFVNSIGDTLYPQGVSLADKPGTYLVEHYNTVPDSPYTFIMRGVYDDHGIPFAQNRNLRDINIVTDVDSLPFSKPAILFRDSTRNVPEDAEFTIQFQRAVRSIPAQKILKVTGIDTGKFNLAWKDDRTLSVIPDSLWPPNQWVHWTLVDSLIRDYRDSTYSDSITSGSFLIESEGGSGSISGTVKAPAKWNNPQIKVEALQQKNSKSPVLHFQTSVDQQRHFRLNRLPEGTYGLRAYYDSDSSGTYSYGRPRPFVPAEYFSIFPDSVEVRARWESSGINIQFPEMK